jgi:hypothetical protein
MKLTGRQAAADAASQAYPRAVPRVEAPVGQRARAETRSRARLDRLAAWMPPLVYLGLALAATWPWVLRPATVLMAPVGGDVSTTIAKFSAIVQSGAVPFVSDRITAVGWPDGLATTPGIDSAAGLSTLYLWVASAAIGPVQALGLMAVLGFVLTGTVTYLFVRRVTGSVGAGLVAGTAYGFFPHLYLMAYAATTYTHMWLFILPLWAFWNLSQAPTHRNALLAGASLVPAIFWTPYYTLHVSVIAGGCIVVLFAIAPRIDLARKSLGLVLLPWVAALIAYVGIGAATSFSDAPDRPLSDFYQQSAHPIMYVFPGANSIWPDSVDQKMVDLVPRALNVNNYIGVSVILLGAFALWTYVRPWIMGRFRGRPSPQAVAALLALGSSFACLLFSLPPRVLHHTVPMPSDLVFHVAPGVRAGQRFVMPLMAGAAVLAGLGTAAILRRVPGRAMLPVAVLLAAIVATDLYTSPPGMTAEMKAHPPALEKLADAPKAPAIELFPWGFLWGQQQRACMAQLVHKKPLVNTCLLGVPPPHVLAAAGVPMCRTLRLLQSDGLRYVIVDLPVPPGIGACFKRSTAYGGWRLLAQDSQYRILELPAPS